MFSTWRVLITLLAVMTAAACSDQKAVAPPATRRPVHGRRANPGHELAVRRPS
jgi:hypothetical protein